MTAGCAASAPGFSATADEVRTAVTNHLSDSSHALLLEFRDLLSLPNVSTNIDDMRRNSDWIESYLEPRGFESRTV